MVTDSVEDAPVQLAFEPYTDTVELEMVLGKTITADCVPCPDEITAPPVAAHV